MESVEPESVVAEVGVVERGMAEIVVVETGGRGDRHDGVGRRG